MSGTKPRITIVGSINMDLVVRSRKLPAPGETITASNSVESPGGKGANQSVAAARLGADVIHLGRVGSDSFADRLIDNLNREGVKTDHVLRTPSISSGLAVVMVEDSGENSIVVVPGSNGEVTAVDVEQHADIIRESDVLVVQLEIPLDAVLAAIDIAREAGVKVIVDPAPAVENLPEELLRVDVICPNQSEAEILLGTPIESVQDARQAAWQLVRRGVKNAIITLGSEGAVLCDGETLEFLAPFAVEAVDTTAAGDAFAGALAVRWMETGDLLQATRFACAAGALAASKPGAQPAMPRRNEIEALLQQHSGPGDE